jgi:phage terminase small subunit
MLKDKHLRFCEEYVIDFNGRRAAVRAGYSELRAAATACDLLEKPKF